MDALQLLRDDHRRVRELFRQFDEAGDASTRKAITDQAIGELMVHAQLEEDIFYPAMQREGMTDLIDHAEEEHHAAETLMNEIIDLDARDGQLEAKFTLLINMVTEHVTEEESQIFPRAAEIGMDRLERIGDQLQELRMQIESAAPSQRRQPQRRAVATVTREVSSAARAATGTSGKSRSSTSKSRSGTGSKAARGRREQERSRKKATTAGSRARSGTRMQSLTKQELYERAQKADIEGRSSMSKEQLVRALQKAG
jgi:hemerythrin superfamily protein